MCDPWIKYACVKGPGLCHGMLLNECNFGGCTAIWLIDGRRCIFPSGAVRSCVPHAACQGIPALMSPMADGLIGDARTATSEGTWECPQQHMEASSSADLASVDPHLHPCRAQEFTRTLQAMATGRICGHGDPNSIATCTLLSATKVRGARRRLLRVARGLP